MPRIIYTLCSIKEKKEKEEREKNHNKKLTNNSHCCKRTQGHLNPTYYILCGMVETQQIYVIIGS